MSVPYQIFWNILDFYEDFSEIKNANNIKVKKN